MSTKAKVEAFLEIAEDATKKAIMAAVEDVVLGGGAPVLVLFGTGEEDHLVGGVTYANRVIPVLSQKGMPAGRITVVEAVNF